MTFAPRLDTLPPAQRSLWTQLAVVPARYVLYGGTALALRLAHRTSIDFDFFAHDPLDHRELEALPFMRGAETLQESANTHTVIVSNVKVSFFGGITFGRVGEPESTTDGVVTAASLADLAGTKIKALVQRIEAKDYVDVAALLEHGMPLADVLGAARALFGATFNPIAAQKALCYFEGGDLATLGDAVKQRLVAAASRDVEAVAMPLASSRLDRA